MFTGHISDPPEPSHRDRARLLNAPHNEKRSQLGAPQPSCEPCLRSHTGLRRTEAGALKPIPDTILFDSNLMTNLDSVLKTKDITLLTKVCIVEAMVFPAVMYRCESWTIKKAEFRRIYAFELSCWKRLLRVPWIARRSNHSILKEINPECLLEGLILKLKLQYFGHLMQRADSLEKTLMLGKIEGSRRRR